MEGDRAAGEGEGAVGRTGRVAPGSARTVSARVARDRNDAGRVHGDLLAMVRMADHTDGVFLIDQLVSISLLQLARAEIDRTLHEAPDLLSDAQLTELAHALGAHAGGRTTIDLAGERMFFLDVVQRIYTDDGGGDGRLCAAGLNDFGGESFFDLFHPDDSPIDGTGFDVGALRPVLASLSGSRKEVLREHERLMAVAEQEVATPLWRKSGQTTDALLNEMVGSPTGKIRNWLLGSIMPSAGRAARNYEASIQQRDATLVSIALELHRRRTSAYPDSLGALVPELLPRVPFDRYTGDPIGYVLDPGTGRPIIYSRGNDRDDDAGRSVLDEDGNRTDSHGHTAWTAAQFQALDSRTQAEYDGDWILFPPRPHDPD